MKPAKDIRYKVLKEIESRWSGRAFSKAELPKELLMQLLEAARWAPSSYNEQPWRFLVSRKGTDGFEKLLSVLLPGNSSWAKDAGALILTFAKKSFEKNGAPNAYAWHDLGQAVAFLSLEAERNGINVHQMGGFKKAEASEIFETPQGFEVVSVIALGFRGEAASLPEKLEQLENSPQVRKEIEEIVEFK